MTFDNYLSWLVCAVLSCGVPGMGRAQGTMDDTHVTSIRISQPPPPPPPLALRRVELTSHDGALHGRLALLLRAEIDTAVAMGRLPLVELGATWCGACQTLDTAMRESSEMIDALAGTYVIHVDIDEWPNAELQPLGLVSENGGIPAVIAVDRTGRSIQQAVDIADMDLKNEVGGMAHAIQRLIKAQRALRPLLPISTVTPIVLDGVTVVDVDHGRPVPNQDVVIQGNRIRTVKPTTIRAVIANGRSPSAFWTLTWDGQRLLAKIPRAAFETDFVLTGQVAAVHPLVGDAFVGMPEKDNDQHSLLGDTEIYRWRAVARDSVQLTPYHTGDVQTSDPHIFPVVRRDADGTVFADVGDIFFVRWRVAPPTITATSEHLELTVPVTARSQRVVWHWSIAPLPAVPMRPRLLDARVGFVPIPALTADSVTQREVRHSAALDTTPPDQRSTCTDSGIYYIVRRRLEKRDPAAALSDVVQPIVFDIDPGTPAQWVPWIQRGVEEWEPAFEAAGFRHALVVHTGPWTAGEPVGTHTVIGFQHTGTKAADVSRENGGMTYLVTDPRTGEILHASIIIHGGNLRGLFGLAGGEKAGFPYADSLGGPLLQAVVAHEVGHSFGLVHNFAGHVSFDPKRGLTPSVMSYNIFDTQATPSDHLPLTALFPHIGAYERWAIAWGYRPLPAAATPAAELPTLERWRAVQDTTVSLQTTSSQCR